eukprot:gene3919-4462_t
MDDFELRLDGDCSDTNSDKPGSIHDEGGFTNEVDEDGIVQRTDGQRKLMKADTAKVNCKTDVIVIFSSQHERKKKDGSSSTVYDLSTYATEGSAEKFIGKGSINSRPKLGGKVLLLLKAFLKDHQVQSAVAECNGNSPPPADCENQQAQPTVIERHRDLPDDHEGQLEHVTAEESGLCEPAESSEDEHGASFPVSAEAKDNLTTEDKKVNVNKKRKTKRSLPKECANKWNILMKSRAQIFWPSMSDIGDEDMWGGKYWDCTFCNETRKEVTVNYTGHFEERNGERAYNELGKCSIVISKNDLFKNWIVRQLADD